MKQLLMLVIVAAVCAGMVGAEEVKRIAPDLKAEAAKTNEPSVYFLGWETEPAMEYGGRNFTTLHNGACRLIDLTIPRKLSFLHPVYEIPSALMCSVFQHEINGHGGRGREFDLDPVYAFGLFAGATGLNKDPENNEQLAVICAGGTESDSVLANNILLDGLAEQKMDGSAFVMALWCKLDFSIYVFITTGPDEEDFDDQYTNGNDIAYWLVARQAERTGASAADVWNDRYTVDNGEPMLQDNYDAAQATAIWNLVDPSMWSQLVPYVWDHVVKGRRRITPLMLPLGKRWGLTVGTRGFLGPSEVTRFADLYFCTPFGVLTAYGRDLDSSVETTYGGGGGFHSIRLGPYVSISAHGDYWETPESEEAFYVDDGWNVTGELNLFFGKNAGLSVKGGAKSEGFFPGTPMAEGGYVGAGFRLRI